MHALVLVRGIKHAVDRYVSDLQAKYFNYKMKIGPPGATQENMRERVVPLQLGVREWKILELCFPETDKDLALTTILGNHKDAGQIRKEYKTRWGWLINTIRRAFGFDKPPEDWDKSQFQPVYCNDIERVLVGMKEDAKDTYGNELI